jgi:hypothetical protein
METVAERIAGLPSPPIARLAPPAYNPSPSRTARVMLAVETFARHMTDEGHQLQQGLEAAGYSLWGRYFDNDEADVVRVLCETWPAVAIMQDKREWDAENSACFDKSIGFRNSAALAADPAIFKLTVCKDAHNEPEYHAEASREIGCHAWIVYYHPDIVCHLAPWIRREHVIRAWHSIDKWAAPTPLPVSRREKCLLSGAITQDLYPFRWRINRAASMLDIATLRHPGYHARGSHTPHFLATLNRYKVAICTCSKLGYSLRKLIEATAAGCIVITDLPPDDPLPEIDGNLVRVSPDIEMGELRHLIDSLAAGYDEAKQVEYALRARDFYDWRRRGRELAEAIEKMRIEWK